MQDRFKKTLLHVVKKYTEEMNKKGSNFKLDQYILEKGVDFIATVIKRKNPDIYEKICAVDEEMFNSAEFSALVYEFSIFEKFLVSFCQDPEKVAEEYKVDIC